MILPFLQKNSFICRKMKMEGVFGLELIYIPIIILLIGLSLFLFFRQKKQHKIFMEEIERNHSETAATIQEANESHKTEYEKLESSLYQHYHDEIKRINDNFVQKLNDKDKYIETLQEFSINRGEVETHNLLQELKYELVGEGVITYNEMIIGGNLFVPIWEDGNLYTRQIDHLVLLPTGVYVIETKHWAGTVLHGVTKNNQNDETLSILLDNMFSSYELKKEQTLVIKKMLNKNRKVDGRSQLELRLLSYGNPAAQVMRTALELRKLLLKENKKSNFVTPIVYYSYSSDEENKVINYSENQNVNVCIEKEELAAFFKNQLAEENTLFTASDLENIYRILKAKNNIDR